MLVVAHWDFTAWDVVVRVKAVLAAADRRG